MRKSTVQRGRPQMTIWRMRIACWIPKATNTHAGCVMLTAFPLQQWLYERVSMLRYTYIAWWWSSERPKHLIENNNKRKYSVRLLCIFVLDCYWLSNTMGWCCPHSIKLLDPELFFLVLAHPANKMRIILEQNTIELWNKQHFEEEKTESIHHV